jgi:hypothetical protein
VNRTEILAAVLIPYATSAELQAYAALAQLAERWRIRAQNAGASKKPR